VKLIREDTTGKCRELFITPTISCSLKNIRNNNEEFSEPLYYLMYSLLIYEVDVYVDTPGVFSV